MRRGLTIAPVRRQSSGEAQPPIVTGNGNNRCLAKVSFPVPLSHRNRVLHRVLGKPPFHSITSMTVLRLCEGVVGLRVWVETGWEYVLSGVVGRGASER